MSVANQNAIKNQLANKGSNPPPPANEVAKVKKTSMNMDELFKDVDIQARFKLALGNRAESFMANIVSAYNSNDNIKKCTPMSVMATGYQAAAFGFMIGGNLGYAYAVPYKTKKMIDGAKVEVMEAQLQLGYKGIYQLALNTGYYKHINYTDVRDGELVGYDRLTGEYTFNWIKDENERSKLPIAGYLAFFEMLSGFRKMLYMTKAEMEHHASSYSQSYKYDKKVTEDWKKSSLWSNQFDLMALKTVLKQLLTKWGKLSIELQKALEVDQAVYEDFDHANYLDNEGGTVNLVGEDYVFTEDVSTEIPISGMIIDDDDDLPDALK